jgi:hypothetical protein
MAEFTHYIYICVYTHHIWRPQGGSSHGAGPWATEACEMYQRAMAALDVDKASLAMGGNWGEFTAAAAACGTIL